MILDEISNADNWKAFLQYKIDLQHLSKSDEEVYRNFINEKHFLKLSNAWLNGDFLSDFPEKHIINKISTNKKRVVYSYNSEENIMLKFIAWSLYRYDNYFAHNCYAFRRNYGVKNAINRLKYTKEIDKMFCLKIDIHNYFNSIDVNILLDKLYFIKEDDAALYNLFIKMLSNDLVIYNGRIIHEKHGVMAGTPTSPFLANVYLSDLDKYFEDNEILYFRYSDDILIFAKTLDELTKYKCIIYDYINKMHLEINPDKAAIYNPGETIEFLGFSYHNGKIDISDSTILKTKGKIKRKANSLRRWARKKNLPKKKAAIGFINTMNYKFYGGDDKDIYDEFTWSKWFFPNITTDNGLKIIDKYMQEYIRYICTGRHYKGNYKITYEDIKSMGYRSLVNEYYKPKK